MTTGNDLSESTIAAMCDAIQAAIKEERETCARLIEREGGRLISMADAACLAAVIRERKGGLFTPKKYFVKGVKIK